MIGLTVALAPNPTRSDPTLQFSQRLRPSIYVNWLSTVIPEEYNPVQKGRQSNWRRHVASNDPHE